MALMFIKSNYYIFNRLIIISFIFLFSFVFFSLFLNFVNKQKVCCHNKDEKKL